MEQAPISGPEKEEKVWSYEEVLAAINDLKEGDTLVSRSGTYRVFMGKKDKVYDFTRYGTDGNKKVESMSESQLISGFNAIERIDKK